MNDIPVAYGTIVSDETVVAPSNDNTKFNGGSSPHHYHQPIPLPVQQPRGGGGGGGGGGVNNPAQPQQNSTVRLSEEAYKALEGQGYTRGLADSLQRNKQMFPLSIWIVDNSGSMSHRDGHRLIETKRKDDLKFVECTRWSEMQQTIDYHAQMAALLKSPTVFRLLNDPGRINGPQQFSVAEKGEQYIDEELAIAQSTMLNTQPGGVTPLSRHLREIRDNIIALEPSLRRDGTRVSIVIATDGVPSNDHGHSDRACKDEFVRALKALEGLPVWVVVRLCTDEDSVVDYWNGLDGNLELSLEVLDDFVAEAAEVYEHNKWLNYGLPLHRMREMGFYHRLFDLLDERKFSKDELREFLRILYGSGNMDGVPDPEADWDGFISSITRLIGKEKKQWNPITKRMEPWINIGRLRREYSRSWFNFF